MSTRKRRIVLILLSGVSSCVIVLGVVVLRSPHEPSYQGKSLSAWIAPFCRQTAMGIDAPAGAAHFEELQPVRHAVAAMGTNAVPFLRTWLNERESGLHQTLRKLLNKQPLTGLRLTDPRVNRIRAIRALAVLGPLAHPAIPDLASEISEPLLSAHAIYALQAIGPDGTRALVNEVTNRNAAVRMQIAGMLISYPPPVFGWEGKNEIPNTVLVEALSRIVEDSSSIARIPAAERLGAFGFAASNAVPVLLAAINDQNPMLRQTAIRALGRINAQPELVIPALTNHLIAANTGERMAAVIALREFGYNAQFEPYLPNRPEMAYPLPGPARTNFDPQNPMFNPQHAPEQR